MGEITRRNRGILLSIFIIVSVLSDYILIGPYGFITVLAPSVGLILVYHMYYKDYFLLSIIVYALGLLVTRFIFIEETIFISIFIVFFKSLVLFCMLLLVDHVVFHLKDNGYKDMNLRDILNYIFIGIFIPLLGATMHLIPIHYVFDYDNSLFWYVNSLIGYMFGFFIFGSALYFAFIYDKNKISRKEFYYSIIYLGITAILSMILFSHSIEAFDHYNFSYLFFLSYLVGAILLNFRVIFLSNYILFASYSMLHINHQQTFDLSTELFSIMMILLVLTGFSVLVKYTFIRVTRKEEETLKLKDSLKNMMYETSTILKNVDNISASNKTFSDDFLIKMFRMGTRVVEKYDKASLYVREDGDVRYIDAIGYDIDFLNGLNLSDKDFVWDYIEPEIVEIKEEVYSKKFREDNKYMSKYSKINLSVRFSIMYDGKAIGGMSFDITEESKYSLTAKDLENYKELSRMINSFYDLVIVQDSNNAFRNDIVISLVRALGLYDSYTGKHSEEVAFLSLEISKRLKLSNSRTQRIYWSAIVHDIGKIGVPYTTITKKGTLTKEERQEIENHTVFGYNILNSVESLKDVAKRVRHHHERWDGTGYPDHLKGNEIPLCSQVLAVCDAVSAMSRNRSYSSAKSVDEILEELHKERGKQFSPKVCDAMIEYIEESKLVKYYIKTS